MELKLVNKSYSVFNDAIYVKLYTIDDYLSIYELYTHADIGDKTPQYLLVKFNNIIVLGLDCEPVSISELVQEETTGEIVDVNIGDSLDKEIIDSGITNVDFDAT